MISKSTKIQVILLRHPQEKRESLGTAPLLERLLPTCQTLTGFSWPNLKKVVGREADPRKWMVLYVGSQKVSQPHPVTILKGRKIISSPQEILDQIEGVIVLDGTWKQAKTLWWRNAWLLKLWQVFLNPKTPSMYGLLRREPRKECLSSLEAVAMTLSFLGEDPGIEAMLKKEFQLFLSEQTQDSVSI